MAACRLYAKACLDDSDLLNCTVVRKCPYSAIEGN